MRDLNTMKISLLKRRNAWPQHPCLKGFTLLESLVVVALVGVLLSLAVPSMSDWRQRHQLQAQAEGLLDSLVLARSEALRRQQRITLCPAALGLGCDAQGQWHQGWRVFVDANDNADWDPGELLVAAHEALPAEFVLGATGSVRRYFSYGPDGRSQSTSGAFMAGTWRFCSPSFEQGWQVVSNALGKPRIDKYTAVECP